MGAAKDTVAIDNTARMVEKRMMKMKRVRRKVAPGRRKNCDGSEGELQTGVSASLVALLLYSVSERLAGLLRHFRQEDNAALPSSRLDER